MNADGYVLDRDGEEYERLRAQARHWEPMTRRVLAAAGLAAGMRCLDVGCGPGAVMRLIGEIVGAKGEVTGVDLDARLGGTATAALALAGPSRYRFVTADVMQGAVPGAPFDLVFARLLLLHMPDPVAVVRRLAAMLRPGGRLVLMDYDFQAMAIRPPDPLVERGFAILTACFRRIDAGTCLPAWVVDAGLPAPTGFAAERIFGPFGAIGGMLTGVLASLAEAAEARGAAERAEIEAVIARCRELATGGSHFGCGPTMHAVWGTV
jgi:SAM-dependent methyltransferase